MAKSKPMPKFVRPKGKITRSEAEAMANALADSLGIQNDQGEKPPKIAP